MAKFSANSDMIIDGAQGPDGYELRSNGLAQRGLPELEMLQVPADFVQHAGILLNSVADYVANQSPVNDGERLAITSPMGSLLARLEAGSAPPTAGFWKKMFGKSAKVQRVCEPLESMEYPKTLLSTMALWRADLLMERGQNDGAREELLASIGWFPGDPTQRAALFMGFPFNWENHLTYAKLSQLANTEEEELDWLGKAFERSEEFERRRIGDSATDLRGVGSENLVASAHAIVAENSRETKEVNVSTGIVMIASPLRGKTERDGTMVAERKMAIVPSLCAQYTSAALDQACALVTEVALAYPTAQLALMTEDIRQLYEGDADEEMQVGGPRPYHTGDRVLSLLLADVARRAYAGLTTSEMRALYGLSVDESARREGEAKMSLLEAREGEAYAQAL